MEKIKILQIGIEDWSVSYSIPENVKIVFAGGKVDFKKETYEIVILERNLDPESAKNVRAMSMGHCLFAVDSLNMDFATKKLYYQQQGRPLKVEDIQKFLDNETKKYFPEPYGEKFEPKTIGIAQGFKGAVKWNGNYCVSLDGDYGDDFNQVAFWRGNIPIEKDQGIEFWLEYKKQEGVEICLSIKQFVPGSLADLADSWVFDENALKDPVIIEGRSGAGNLFCSLMARGTGKLDIIALHDRISRWDQGVFMVGGQRHVTSEREEIFSYFEPGDMRPPLAVYFSGYKTREGFEGYRMMKNLGCPFLLIAEQRFEGGGFYLGSEEFEKKMVDIINNHLNKLGFYPDQLVLSGISMGTIGSLYYGCDLRPHALIIGKPLASLGDIAKNEKLKRPKGFPTSLDLLQHYSGGMQDDAIKALNERVWSKIRKTDFSRTKIIASYMYEDDYDATAYNKLLSELNSAGVQVYGKGLHGRHNDNTTGIVSWFKGQYDRVLKEDFDRK